MYINAHDHLDFYKDLDDAIKIINQKSIYTLAVSMDIDDFLYLETIKNPLIKIGFGIHPWKVEEDTKTDNLEYFIKKADFIGEIGLDFYWEKRKDLYPKQVEIFEFFLQMAKKHKKVCNIHTKGAELETLLLLEKYELKGQIIHWYSGDLNLLDRYLKLDSYFTISSDIGYSKKTDELIKLLPLNRILTETDGPSSLEWVNGEYGNPDYIIDIVSYVAKIKKLKISEVKNTIFSNLLELNKKQTYL